jgi:hydroxymethylglutaryl-CoA lyase
MAEVGMKLQICLITIWSCPFKGRTDPKLAIEFADRAVAMGCTSLSHSDPYGDVTPPQAFEYFSEVVARHPNIEHYFHNHDWRGFGIANYLAAMQAGVTRFDTCLGGIGGWFSTMVDGVPVKGAVEYRERPGRTGLVSTEDFVLMCDAMGVETGIDVEKMQIAGQWVEKIVGRRLNAASLPWGPVTKAPRPGRWPASHGRR